MTEDPLRRPAPPGQINRSSLRQTGAMTEAPASDQPAFLSLRLDHEQGAGKPPKRATDLIQTQHNGCGGIATGDLQRQNATTDSTLSHPELQGRGQRLNRWAERLTKFRPCERAAPAEAWMLAAVSTVSIGEKRLNRLALLQRQGMPASPAIITIWFRPQV